ncbi:MAG: hypothetical protein HUJ26_19725 [Planctomycetaceae bacterium]|nr:hypothetical protein [Planctomycetaceae bacterium]
MSFVKYRTFMSLLLTAGMLFASFTPPALLHAHEDGHQTHDHYSQQDIDTAGEHLHEHSHAHENEHTHCHPKQPASQFVPSLASHIHLTLFGFEFTLPKGQTPGEDNENGSGSSTVIRWLDREINARSSISTDYLLNNLLVLVSDDLEKIDAVASQETSEVTLSSLPLCDSARRERSGALLI